METPEQSAEAGNQHAGRLDGVRSGQWLVLFDGDCGFCNATVRWIIGRDRRGVLRYARLQSKAAQQAIEEAKRSVAGARALLDPLPESVIVISGGPGSGQDVGRGDSRVGGVHVRSDATIAIGRALGWPWSSAAVLRLLPKGVRDWAYGWVARRRYRILGRQQACQVMPVELRNRFLDADEILTGSGERPG